MRATSEADLAILLEDGLRAAGITWYHTHDSRRSAEGFPDYVIRTRPLIMAELKREGGRLTAAQAEWLAELASPGAVSAIVAVGPEGVMQLLRVAIASAGRTRQTSTDHREPPVVSLFEGRGWRTLASVGAAPPAPARPARRVG